LSGFEAERNRQRIIELRSVWKEGVEPIESFSVFNARYASVMRFVRATFVVLLAIFFSNVALAFSFGRSEEIRYLVDIGAKGPNGEALYLGNKLTFHKFLASYDVQDDGHVIGFKGDSKRYIQMPMADRVRALQQAGLMPNPLPTYELTRQDYFFGHLLWFALPLVTTWVGIGVWWDARRRKKGWVDPTALLIKMHMNQYSSSPPTLPVSFKGRSLIPGANDLVVTEAGFAFTSVSGPNDLIHWRDIAGFGLGKLSGKALANWRYSQEFRGLTLEQVLARTDGMSQSATFGPYQQSPEEVIGLLNATWAAHREVAPRLSAAAV
jgi:hypothetical protein